MLDLNQKLKGNCNKSVLFPFEKDNLIKLKTFSRFLINIFNMYRTRFGLNHLAFRHRICVTSQQGRILFTLK